MLKSIVCMAAVCSVMGGIGCTSSGVNAQSKDEASVSSATRKRAECPNFKNVAVKQQTPVWCWAASAEMVHKYYGNNDVTQEALAQQITNVSGTDAKKAKAAGLQEIMVALNPDFRERVTQRSADLLTARAQTGDDSMPRFDAVDFALGQMAPWSATSDDLIDAISTQNPAIVGLRGEGQSMGHAVVVYATSYEPIPDDAGKKAGASIFGAVLKEVGARNGVREDQVDASGIARGPAKYKLSEIEYIDPMDGKRYRLNAEGFKNRVDFIMTKPRARDILERQLIAVR
jgi:flagellar biosynthesis regulator FlaF